jgi:hypothetical protein
MVTSDILYECRSDHHLSSETPARWYVPTVVVVTFPCNTRMKSSTSIPFLHEIYEVLMSQMVCEKPQSRFGITMSPSIPNTYSCAYIIYNYIYTDILLHPLIGYT